MALAEVSRLPNRASNWRPSYGWSLGTVTVVVLAAWYTVLSSGGWSYDDNLLLEEARFEGFSWTFLGGSTFGHWGMGYPATYSLFNRLMPIDYRWALLLMLVELGVAMLLLTRVMEMLVGRGLIPLLSAAYLGISVLLIRSLQWPAQGFQTFPTLIFDLLCLWAYLRYQRDPRLRWVLASAGAIAAGLLFYEKPVFMPFYLLVLRALVLNEKDRPRTVVKAIWRERIMWLAYIAVLVAYGLGRVAANATATGAGAFPPIGELAHGLWLMWVKALVPGLFGYELPTANVDTLQLIGGCFLQVLVAGLVIVSIWRKRSAWRAWAALALFVFATWLLIGAERLGTAGLEAATDQRFLFDFAWLTPVLVCLAFSRRSFIHTPVASTHAPDRRPRPRMSLLALPLMLAYVCVSVAVIADWQTLWGGRAARAWEQNLQHGLARLQRGHTRVTLADNFVPGYMITTSFVPYSYLSYVAPEYGGQINANGPVVGQLFVVDALGRLRPAHVARVWDRFRLRDRCAGAISPAPLQLQRVIPGRLEPAAGPYYVRLTYSSAGVAHLPLFVDDGSGYPGGPNRLVTVAQGTGQSIAWLGGEAPRGVILDSPPYVCLRQLAIVTLAINR